MKDNEIISLFELRDEHAIEALSDKYHPYCYKIAWNLLTNKEDSEECLNDTWFSVWSLIPPKKPSVLSHFCGRITRNLSIDRLRKKYADRRPDLHMADVLGEMDHLSVTYTIEDQLAEKELLEIINDFLGKMNAEDRDIFVRRYWFFDSIAAIAKRHAMSVGSVKMNLYRSRKKLLKVLKKGRKTLMKKFDFSKGFGNIDPKYIEEAEREWSEKKENRRPKGWSKAAAACVIVTLGSVIFSNPHIQAAIKNITLSIGETLGFPKGIESYTEVLNTSKEDKGITVTLKEVVLDNGVLLTKVHAEKTSSGQKDTDDVQDDWTFANTQLDIDYQKTTINGQKIEEYESGHLLPYSDEDLLNTGLDENVYDAVLESRFSLDGDLGENPEVHLVLGAYQNENLGEDYFAEFEFDFSIPHEELMKQTVHKKLEDVSVKTEEGTVKLTDFSMNKLQSIIKAEIPEELEEKLYNGNEMMLMGTDSKGNQVQYE